MHDVIVIGAGIGGLSAAVELAASGRSVLVLEAGDPAIAAAATQLGEALWHVDRRDEARRHFEEAQRIFEEGGPSTAESLEELEARLERLGAD